MKTNVDKLLSPKSIAVIGVSGDSGKVGFTGATGLMNNLIKFGFKGEIYPVNPKYDSIMGYRAYSDIQSLPDDVDLIAIGLKRESVIPIIEECIKKRIKSAVVITSGFSEENSIEGIELQRQLKETSEKYDFRICGPNCLGIVNVHEHAAISTSGGLSISKLPKGHIGLASQSGALSSAFLGRAETLGVGYSYVISSGNEVDMEISDYIEYLAKDPNTKVVAAFIEGIRNGDKFVRAAKSCYEAGKPLVVFKVGKSEKAAKSASAHTGSLTGSDEVHDAIFERYGVIRVHTLDDLLMVSETFVKLKGKKLGKRIGILSVSGGAGGVIADIAEVYGLEIPNLTSETTEELKKLLPSFAALGNPVDATGEILKNPELFIELAQIIERDRNIDVLLFCITALPPSVSKVFTDVLIQAQGQFEKPGLICWYSGDINLPDFNRLKDTSFPCFQTLEQMISCVSTTQIKPVVDYKINMLNQLEAGFYVTPYEEQLIRGEALSEMESKSIISKFGIPITRGELVNSPEQAKQAAQRIGYPIALKIDSPDILHKSDSGCVVLDINNISELETGFQKVVINAAKIKDARINGVLLQEMLPPSKEVIIGVKNDPQFGPVVMFGLGGIFVEVLKDVTFRIAPFSKETALTMIKEIKSYRILEGVRGQAGADIDALADTLHKVSVMAATLRNEVDEIDINPLMVFEGNNGVKAADALIIGKKRGGLLQND